MSNYVQLQLQLRRNRSRKNQNVSISFDSVYDSVAYDPVKTRLSESEAEAEEPTNRKVRNRTLSLFYSSASATPTMQFSLDCKQRRHKQVQCSASDSVCLIFTRSYRSTLLITTPTTTPLLVKTSLSGNE